MRRIAIAILIVLAAVAVGFAEVVTVMHGWPGEQAPAFQKIVDAFEAEHPDIDVVVEIVGRDRPTILATRLAGGNPPDLTPHPWIGLMKEWADSGEIVDLAGLVDTSDINPALVPIGEYDPGNGPARLNQTLTIDIPVRSDDRAALVTYPVLMDGRRVMEMINEVIFEPGNPAQIVGVLSNFDVHNTYDDRLFDDFELYLIGDVRVDHIRRTYDRGRWGRAVVSHGTPGGGPGVTIRWADPDDPVQYCEWIHFGVEIDPTAGEFDVRAFWTTSGEGGGGTQDEPPGIELPMAWQTWDFVTGELVDIIEPIDFEVELDRRFVTLPEVVPLDDLVVETIDETVASFGRTWTPVDGAEGMGLYGLFIFPNVKSLVWYNPRIFAANGYEIPNTWFELQALSQQIVADGGMPWSIGLESGAASGWPGTDWIEDIMLRTAGPDIYDQWVAHEIPWTDPRVKRAFETFGNLFDGGYVLGGAIGTLTTNFGDAADPLFTDPPTALMHHQATFIQGFFNDHFDGLVAGEDFDVFPLPTITPAATPDGSIPLLVSGDVVTVFDDRPEVIAFAQFLTSETAANIWSSELGELSAYIDADPAQFENPITRKAQEMLLNATVSRFDGSDLMPGSIGAGAFWSGVLDYVSGINLDTVLETIEAAAQEAY